MRFRLSYEPISPTTRTHSQAGGFVTFEGKVRDHADGRTVTALEYEAFPEMAEAQGNAIVTEAIERFTLIDANVSHRLGHLCVGDTAVIVQTESAHRRQSFEACEWIMDQIKWRVPIWKRETYDGKVSQWVHAEAPPVTSNFDDRMYARQIRLPEVGEIGQQKLDRSRVLFVGVGGLASGSLPPIVGSGVGTIGLVDSDTVEISNLHRQTLFALSDQGRQKVERAASFAKKIRPSISIETFLEALTKENVERLVSSFDWVIDGTDSLETKFLLNKICRKLGVPLVSASVHQFEGQILTVLPGGPCLQCVFPVQPPENCVGTCAVSGVLGVVPNILGALQANELIKRIIGLEPLS